MPGQVRRTDGRWDPAARGMFFLAGARDTPSRLRPQVPNLYAVNDFAEPGRKLNRPVLDRVLVKALDVGCPVFLDSGIFWLTNRHKRLHGMTMDEALALHPTEVDDFDWLFDTYVELCMEFRGRLWGYNELDQGGRDRKIETRARLEREGLNPIPVYHPLNDGWDYFDELAEGYDRICWGNVVQANRFVRMRMVATLAERHRTYPDLWVHLLGLTPNEFQAGIPYDSCDSSQWTIFFRWPPGAFERAMARSLTRFDRRYWYTDAAESAACEALSVFMFDGLCIGLDDWRARLRDEVGFVDYPAFAPGEAVPCPAR